MQSWYSIILKKSPLFILITIIVFFLGFQEANSGRYAVCPGVCDLGWAPEQDILAMVNEFGLWLYDVNEADAEPELFPFENATSLDFSPDGESIAITACVDISESNSRCNSLISIFNLETLIWQEFVRYDFEVTNIQFSPDGTLLAVEQRKNNQRGIKIINLLSNEETEIVDSIRTNIPHTFIFSPNGLYLATVNVSFNLAPEMLNGIAIWDIFTGEQIAESDGDLDVRDAIFSPDSTTMFYVEASNHVTQWDFLNDEIISVQTYSERPSDILHTYFLVEDPTYLIASLLDDQSPMDRTIFVWDLVTGDEIFSEDLPPNNNIDLVAMSGSGYFLASTSTNQETTIVDVWNIDTDVYQSLDLSE